MVRVWVTGKGIRVRRRLPHDEENMRRIGWVAFVAGILITIGVYVYLNVRSYSTGLAAYSLSNPFGMSHTGFDWGFPLPWLYEGTCAPCYVHNWFTILGLCANVNVCLMMAAFAGYILKRFAERIFESSGLK